MSKKGVRQQRIKALIQASKIENQEQLAHRLAKEGIKVAQTTLSRDMAELHILKGPGYYVINPSLVLGYDNQEELQRLLQQKVTAVTLAMNLIVVHTHPGSAQALGLELDNSSLSEIVGTLAGDDTVFIATNSEKAAQALRNKLKKMMV